MDNAAQMIRAQIVERLISTMPGYPVEDIVKYAATLADFVVSDKKPAAIGRARKVSVIRRKK